MNIKITLLLIALMSVAACWESENMMDDNRKGGMLGRPGIMGQRGGEHDGAIWGGSDNQGHRRGPPRGGDNKGQRRGPPRGGRRSPPRGGSDNNQRRGPPRGGRRGPPRHAKNSWWKKTHNKDSMGGQLRGKMGPMFSKFKSFSKKCMQSYSADSKSDIKSCLHKLAMMKKKLWYKFHAANPIENMMRWHKRASNTPEKMKWAKAKSTKDYAPYKAYKAEYLKFKSMDSKLMDGATKAAMKKVKYLFKKSLQKKHLLTGYKLYQQQEKLWGDDKVGKCIRLRNQDFMKNLKPVWGISEEDRKAQRLELKAKLMEACRDVDSTMPFANGGCIEKLADNYSTLMSNFKDFLHERSDANVSKMADGLTNGYFIMQKCLTADFEKKAPTCKDYVKQELQLDDLQVENVIGEGEGLAKAVKIGVEWNKLGKGIGKIMDEDFWLNAPEDCGVASNLEKVDTLQAWKGDFDHELNREE
jgi:hypothetical protein